MKGMIAVATAVNWRYYELHFNYDKTGDARRMDAFDLSSRGAAHFSKDGKESAGWLSRNCICLHKPEDITRLDAEALYTATCNMPSTLTYLYRQVF